MSEPISRLVVYTDVDGCLLNKSDYRWSDAAETIRRLQRLHVPLILSSSKTAAELAGLQQAIGLVESPFIAENGALVVWPDEDGTPHRTVLGADRSHLLTVLARLKPEFRFRSFRDLGVDGVMQATDLPQPAARQAMQREATEPLLWDDQVERIAEFRERLAAEHLTLTQGGRFWHVAGPTTKGRAMQVVTDAFQQRMGERPTTVAIGDSPIDQSMLDVADHPIGIPAPDGTLQVTLPADRGIRAPQPGAAGWSAAVTELLNRLNAPATGGLADGSVS